MSIDLELRKTGIGGSDAGAICGVSQFATPLDIYNQKIGLADNKKATLRMQIGNDLEPTILRLYEESTGNKAQLHPGFKRHATYDFMIANVDALVADSNTLVEFKCSSNTKDWGEEGTSDIPLSYLCQVTHYLSVWDLEKCDVALLLNNGFDYQFKLYHVVRDEALEAMLIEKEKYFWEEYILKELPPPPSSFEETKNFFKAVPKSSIDANEQVIQIVDDLKRLREKIDELEHKEKECKKFLMEFMQENEALVEHDKTLITWKSFEANRFDVERFKKEHNHLYNEYLKKSETRRFLIK